ncbi:hypothetical protein QFC20_005777 [Naganishia adeliensis]|uniref:Uncharacterized protein n=1 Tax=Naganishia adeliensis TaxID=92952 RepID=A0ACC2VIV1_9TREE|nr:hypothetical protein QFC20_005777 [Naganishia adeliensis]
MSAQYNRRTSPLLKGSPSASSFAGLSLFHDNSRSHLLDDLTVLCGDIKFPLLNMAKEKIVKKCGTIEKSKPVGPAKRQESSTFASLRDVFLCRTRSVESSFFDDKHLQQSSSQSANTFDWLGHPAMQYPFEEKNGTGYSDNSLTSTSSGMSSESEKLSFNSLATSQVLDTQRVSRRPSIFRRRAMLPLWINTALARIYPNNSESRFSRINGTSFPSSPQTLSLEFPTSPASFTGIKVDVDGLNERRESAGSGGSAEKKPRNKWNGNWV